MPHDTLEKLRHIKHPCMQISTPVDLKLSNAFGQETSMMFVCLSVTARKGTTIFVLNLLFRQETSKGI